MRPTLLALLLVGCKPDEHQGGLTETENAPPEVAIAEVDFHIDQVLLAGTASDPDQPADTLRVELSSDVAGDFAEVVPYPDGTWAWEGSLEAGLHQVEALVRDDEGLQASASLEIDVPPVVVPDCEIVSPSEGATFASGASIHFLAEASDPDGADLRLLWRSDLQGALFMGASFNMVLKDGVHIITLTADNLLGGVCTDEVAVQVGG